jgi:hypothetical protein
LSGPLCNPTLGDKIKQTFAQHSGAKAGDKMR